MDWKMVRTDMSLCVGDAHNLAFSAHGDSVALSLNHRSRGYSDSECNKYGIQDRRGANRYVLPFDALSHSVLYSLTSTTVSVQWNLKLRDLTSSSHMNLFLA